MGKGASYLSHGQCWSLSVVQQLKDKFLIVHKLKQVSGLGSGWTDTGGMNIDLQTKGQWDLIVDVCLVSLHVDLIH